MSVISLAANSTTLILNGQIISDFIDGDTVTMTPVNPLSAQTRSLNSVNIQKRSDAYVYDLVFRVPKYSDADIYMKGEANQDSVTVFDGSLKEDYTKDGEDFVTTYTLSSATITTLPTDTRNNQDGNNAMEYSMRVNKAVRV